MSSSSDSSLSQEACKRNQMDSPVYVVSKIKGLSASLRSISNTIFPELCIEEVLLPANTRILNQSDIEKLTDAEIIVVDPRVLAYNYKNMPKLKWAHSTWAGVEPLFEVMEEKPQFMVTRHGDEDFCMQMAEYVMAHVLILQKNFRNVWASQLEKSWSKMEKYAIDDCKNIPLKDLTIGILGVGNMGQAIAKFFKPHGSRVIGFGRKLRLPSEYGFFDKIEVSLKEVLAVSNYVVNTLPSTPETIALLDSDGLKACTLSPVFINVGRSSIISEDSLLKALENQWVSHAVLDVFQKEPLPTDSKLWDLVEQVTITPHSAAVSLPVDVARSFLSGLVCYAHKSPMKNVVDWEKGY